MLISDMPTAAAAMPFAASKRINLFVLRARVRYDHYAILSPLADLATMSRQLMITAFQVGDGLTNLIVPTSGGTLAMLALGRVTYKQWLKAVMPFMIGIYVICWIGLVIGHYIGY